MEQHLTFSYFSLLANNHEDGDEVVETIGEEKPAETKANEKNKKKKRNTSGSSSSASDEEANSQVAS